MNLQGKRMKTILSQILISCAVMTAATGTVQAQVGLDGGGGSSASGGRRARGAQTDAQQHAREVRLAQRELSAAVSEVRRLFFESSEYQTAVSDLADAMRAYHSAREQGAHAARQSVDFNAIRVDIHRLERGFDTLRARRGASARHEIARVAGELLQRRSQLSRLEMDVLRSDETFMDARYAMIDARIRLDGLRRDLHQQIRTDPRCQAARERLAQARRG